jgi:hypothetical protein
LTITPTSVAHGFHPDDAGQGLGTFEIRRRTDEILKIAMA